MDGRRIVETSHRRARGFTLVELLVCMAITGLLAALLLPAIQWSRERARSLHCKSNLHQLGIAAHSYHADHGVFPVNSEPYVRMLPYLGEQPFYAAIQANRGFVPGVGKLVAVFNCPSDAALQFPKRFGSYELNDGSRFRPYGSNGIRETTLFYKPFTGMADVTDGLSQTAFFSEQLVRWWSPSVSEIAATPRRFIWETPSTLTGANDLEAFVSDCRDRRTSVWLTAPSIYSTGWDDPRTEGYNHLMTPNSVPCYNGPVYPGVSVYPEHCSLPATSLHSGGVNVLLADGSVRFIMDSIDLNVWRALGTRNENDHAGME